MPIMAPVGDLVGLTRQSTVLAFQLGDGLTNAIYPTSSTMLGFLAASKIPYSVWLKYVIKLVILLSLVTDPFRAGRRNCMARRQDIINFKDIGWDMPWKKFRSKLRISFQS
mgnify:CR=1 FL=1